MGDKEKNRSSAGGKTGKGVKNYAKGPWIGRYFLWKITERTGEWGDRWHISGGKEAQAPNQQDIPSIAARRREASKQFLAPLLN
jgi:hypothetical protein